MISRRKFIQAGGIALLVLGSGANARAQNFSIEAESGLTAEVLIATLYARTPEEKEFCVYVIAQRDKGELPNKILYASYRYAVQKETDRRFIYFKKAIEKLGKDGQIDFDFRPTPSTPTKTTPFSFLKNLFRYR